jgi:hypothetical protein
MTGFILAPNCSLPTVQETRGCFISCAKSEFGII